MKTEGSRQGLFCLDWDKIGDILEIWSVETDDNYQRFEAVIVPCNYIHNEFSDIGDSIAEECVADLKSQRDYLGNFKSIVLFEE